jgi:PleD family two-component response regulator
MKTAQNHYNVLIQPKSQNDAEKIISMFRGAGMAVRAHRITSQQDLKEQLKDGSWDLLVTDNHHPEVPLAFTLESLKQAKIDLPVLLITEEPTAEMIDKALKLGIQDVISASAAAHFTQAAKREMENCRARNRLLLLEKEHQELLDRAESLLSNSDEAIAYVSDGIIMRTNDNFASTFGYELSELDCASMIDLVSEGDHDRFKNFFRLFGKGEAAPPVRSCSRH